MKHFIVEVLKELIALNDYINKFIDNIVRGIK